MEVNQWNLVTSIDGDLRLTFKGKIHPKGPFAPTSRARAKPEGPLLLSSPSKKVVDIDIQLEFHFQAEEVVQDVLHSAMRQVVWVIHPSQERDVIPEPVTTSTFRSNTPCRRRIAVSESEVRSNEEIQLVLKQLHDCQIVIDCCIEDRLAAVVGVVIDSLAQTILSRQFQKDWKRSLTAELHTEVEARLCLPRCGG